MTASPVIAAYTLQKLFRNLISYLGGADLRVLSAFGSYIYLRQKCGNVASLSRAARAKDHTAAVEKATSAMKRSKDSQAKRRGQGLGRSDSGSWGGFQRGSSPPAHRYLGNDGSDADDADYAVSETVVPVSLINLVVHADQRRAPLRMLHFADALPSPPPLPQPPPSHNTPSPRLLKPTLPNRGRDSGEMGMLPTTTEGVAAAAGGARTERPFPDGRKQGALREEESGGGAFAGKCSRRVRLCATCEVLPVAVIDDGEGAAAATVKDAATLGDGCRDLGEQAKEGDCSANKQVRGTCFCVCFPPRVDLCSRTKP